MANNLNINMTQLYDGVIKLQNKTNDAILMYCNTEASKLEGIMKKDAPWIDRTGEARRRLTGSAEKNGGIFSIKLAHGVEYGIMLEQAHEKRYAIIEPTIRLEGPSVIKGFDRLIDKLKIR